MTRHHKGEAGAMRSIFITGGASGIGHATAKLFASKGWRVGIGDIQQPKEPIDGVAFFSLDVRDRDQWHAALDAFCGGPEGALDVLVNNAGIVRYGRFVASNPTDSDLLVDINIKGVINGCHIALPHLRAGTRPAIVNMASAGAIYGGADLAVYSATKFAVRGLSEALDGEFAPLGVDVRCVMPWFTDTPMVHQSGFDRNTSLNDEMARNGSHAPAMPAAAVWDAVHGKALHYPVGRPTKIFRLFARIFPDAMRNVARKGVMKKDAARRV
ncbi:SDR family oxidoreductase [Sphingomonas montanisoli]|uniref:SDR family oxidoreductase n=2 Tax=Sphingomonas montanisoli TaxID=2606412 RepID=A0A5D9CER3_9SPHN|nr:SDR family oxidoreductase [Sphingomonas montanisoli]